MIRQPIKRNPLTLDDLREPIFFDEPTELYPLYKFEGYYEIDILGNIIKNSTGEYVKQYENRVGRKSVCIIHPDAGGSTLCANVDDLWSSTFLGDDAIDEYGYF